MIYKTIFQLNFSSSENRYDGGIEHFKIVRLNFDSTFLKKFVENYFVSKLSKKKTSSNAF